MEWTFSTWHCHCAQKQWIYSSARSRRQRDWSALNNCVAKWWSLSDDLISASIIRLLEAIFMYCSLMFKSDWIKNEFLLVVYCWCVETPLKFNWRRSSNWSLMILEDSWMIYGWFLRNRVFGEFHTIIINDLQTFQNFAIIL